MEKQKTISEGTLIPISLLVTLLLFSAWLTTVYAQGLSNNNAIVEIKAVHEKNIDKVYEKLGKIEDKIDKIIERSKK